MKPIVALVLASALLAPFPYALAQERPSECIGLVDDVERLACYDAVFRFGGDVSEGVVVQSEQSIPAQPSGRGYATMTIACEEDGLVVRFAFAGNTLSPAGSTVGISLQRDLSRAQAMTLPVDTGNTEIVMSGEGAALAFLNSLAGTTNLTARVTPANARSLNVRFRVVDLPQQVAPVIAACN